MWPATVEERFFLRRGSSFARLPLPLSLRLLPPLRGETMAWAPLDIAERFTLGIAVSESEMGAAWVRLVPLLCFVLCSEAYCRRR